MSRDSCGLQITLQDQFGKYSTYRGMIGRYVYVRTHDRDAADDLVQDTFTDALIGLPDADDDVVGWLLRLAARSCTRHVWVLRTLKIIYADGQSLLQLSVVVTAHVGRTWAGVLAPVPSCRGRRHHTE